MSFVEPMKIDQYKPKAKKLDSISDLRIGSEVLVSTKADGERLISTMQ